MSSDEVVEDVHSVILVVKYFDNFEEFLQLKVFFTGNLRELDEDSFPNFQPVIFDILQLDFGGFQDPHFDFWSGLQKCKVTQLSLQKNYIKSFLHLNIYFFIPSYTGRTCFWVWSKF